MKMEDERRRRYHWDRCWIFALDLACNWRVCHFTIEYESCATLLRFLHGTAMSVLVVIGRQSFCRCCFVVLPSLLELAAGLSCCKTCDCHPSLVCKQQGCVFRAFFMIDRRQSWRLAESWGNKKIRDISHRTENYPNLSHVDWPWLWPSRSCLPPC